MNSFQKSITHLIALTRTMTLQTRMVVALVLALIVISAAYLLNVGISGDRVYLFGDVSVPPHQIISMQAAFAKAGLNEATIEGERIRVPRGQQSQYLGALADAEALPRNFGDTLRKMLESNSPFSSKKQQEEKMKFAMQEELSQLVSRMNGVEWATVMYDVQPPSFPHNKREVRPCVTVKSRGSTALTPEQVQRIRHVVGPPIGAAPQEVTLVDVQGATYPAGTAENSQTPGYELYASTQHEYERLYKEKIQTALSFVSGAVVTVNVELHAEVEDSAQLVKIDAKTKLNDSSQEQDHPHAPAKLEKIRRFELGSANSPAAIDLKDANGYETRHIKRAGLTPKRVTVSVAVPRNYFEQQWQLRSNNREIRKPESAEIAKMEDEIRGDLKQHVLQVLPTSENEQSQLNSVTVTVFSTAPPPEIAQLTHTEQIVNWLEDHSALVVAAVSCLLGLLMLRSIVHSATRINPHEPEPSNRHEIDEPHEVPRSPVYSRTRSRPSLQASTSHDELSEIVRDNPNAAASVLRSWIGSTN